MTPIIDKNISEHVENLCPYIWIYIDPYTFLPTYHFYFLATQINNECLPLCISNCILLKQFITPYLLRRQIQVLMISPISTICIFTSFFFFFFKQVSWEDEEANRTAQKIISLSQSSRSRLGSCQGTKSLASLWKYGRKFRRNINTIVVLMFYINTIVLPFLLLSSRWREVTGFSEAIIKLEWLHKAAGGFSSLLLHKKLSNDGRVTKHWDMLPREVVEATSLQAFSDRLGE